MRHGKPGERMRWNAVIDRVYCNTPIVGVELGVFEGTLSAHLLAQIPKLTLYMVDRWTAYTTEEIAVTPHSKMPQRSAKYFEEAHGRALVVSESFPDRAVVVQTDTVEATDFVPDGVDFVFVDARHDYQGIVRDIEAWLPKVTAGGWMFFHDYGSDRNHPDVRKAVDEYFQDIEIDADHVAAVRVR